MAEGRNEVAVDPSEQPGQPSQPASPKLGDWREGLLPRLPEIRNCLVTGLQTLSKKVVEVAAEGRVRQLRGQNRSDPEIDRARDRLSFESVQHLEDRKVGIDRRLADPIGPVGPSPVIEHVRQMAVEGENQIHGASLIPEHAPIERHIHLH